MEILAIIPARGGSKGIPKKNISLFAGEPLIAHTIKSAHESKLIKRTIVSTDDPDIAEISKRYGAEVIKRPAEISGDRDSSESALIHVIDHLRKAEGYLPDLIVFLQCTSPLTSDEDIDRTITTLIKTGSDCAFSSTESYQFLWNIGEDGFAHEINHDAAVRHCRQDLQPQYCENGAVYVMWTEGFLRAGHRFFGNISLSVMPPERSVDIDTPIDFEFAEYIFRILQRERPDSS